MLVGPEKLDQHAVVEPVVLRLRADNRRINSSQRRANHGVPIRWSSPIAIRPVRCIVLRRTAAGRRAEPAIVPDGQARQARLVRTTVAGEHTVPDLARHHGGSSPRHDHRDLRTSPPICMTTNSTMWRRPRMLSTSVHERHDNREGRSPPDAFPLVATTIRIRDLWVMS